MSCVLRTVQVTLKLHPAKCIMYTTSARWCKRIITSEGVRFDSHLSDSISQRDSLSTGAQQQQFICTMQWMCNAIPLCTAIIQPLSELLEMVFRLPGKRSERAVSRIRRRLFGLQSTTTVLSNARPHWSTWLLQLTRTLHYTCAFIQKRRIPPSLALSLEYPSICRFLTPGNNVSRWTSLPTRSLDYNFVGQLSRRSGTRLSQQWIVCTGSCWILLNSTFLKTTWIWFFCSLHYFLCQLCRKLYYIKFCVEPFSCCRTFWPASMSRAQIIIGQTR